MNKKILFVLTATWILAGCAPQTIANVTCTPYVGIQICEGQKNDPKVTLNLDTMTLDRECVNAKKGRVIIFELESTSEITKGSVEIFPKDADNDWWLAGTNSPNKKRILILAPKKKDDGSSFPKDIYFYGIRTPSSCIDPRVNVEN